MKVNTCWLTDSAYSPVMSYQEPLLTIIGDDIFDPILKIHTNNGQVELSSSATPETLWQAIQNVIKAQKTRRSDATT